MKRAKVILTAIISLTLIGTFAGCGQTSGSQEKEIEITHEDLTDRENYLLMMTGNNIHKYNLDNLPKDVEYQFSVNYITYEKGEMVSDEEMISFWGEPLEEGQDHHKNEVLSFNFQEDKIRMALGGAYNQYEPKEDLSSYSRSFNTKQINLKLGEEVYIFYGTTGDSLIVNESMWNPKPIGTPIEETELNKIIEKNGKNVFIKFSIEGVI